jgi:hypothetical protein
MCCGLNALTANIKLGDVATWIAAIGTSGTLITGMYIILRDRMNQYRSQFDELIISAYLIPEPGLEERHMLILDISNRAWRSFVDVDIYCQVNGRFADETLKPIGFHCSRGSIQLRKKNITVPIYRGLLAVNYSSTVVLTYQATDAIGRTWLKERKKPAQLVTWRRRFFVQHKLERLNSKIRRNVGSQFVEVPPWSTDTRTDI